MKKIVLVCLFVLASSSFALADWADNFTTDYQEIGIGQAVINAMKEGATPALIIEEGLKFEGLNPVQLVMALYCAGGAGPDIKQAGIDAGISELAMSAGYEKSVAECGIDVADTQAYTPTFAPAFAGSAPEGGTTVYASSSAF